MLVEPVSGAPAYPLLTAADALAVIDRAGEPNIGLLADLYHLAVNGDDVDKVIADHTDRIATCRSPTPQAATSQAPGRCRCCGSSPTSKPPDTDGWVGLEYKPSGASADSFGWIENKESNA